MSRRVDSARPSKKSRTSKKPAPQPSSRLRKVLGVLALVAAGGLLLTAIIQMNSGNDIKSATGKEPAATGQEATYRQLAKLARRSATDPTGLGKVDAPVVMIEYSDFQCPYCRKFGLTMEPDLIAKYVDTGVLRIEWRNFPIFGDESQTAARASWAAGQQGKFWEMHKALFENGPEKKNTGVFTPERMAEIARLAGVPDLNKFRADLDSDAANKALAADTNEGYNLGITSTPAFLINGRPVLGAQPLDQFEAMIEAAEQTADHTE
ncbi:DsbA family protein [Nocardia sp. NPDC051030]|uniref:DsbA family protein n=1 Tax=Nocardia sp. NPDC051030 TaxID=3155162 RepID=UPI0034158078